MGICNCLTAFGTYGVNNICVPCLPSCATCSIYDNCLSCHNATIHTLNLGVCKCRAGQFPSSNTTCTNC